MPEDDDEPQAMSSWSWQGLVTLALMGIGTGWLIIKLIGLVANAILATRGLK